MATYAIGDIQGCFAELRELLQKIGFSPEQDQLWLVGDLVNRGPDSLAVLRWARDMGDAAVTVLGNHDLHLLAVAEGLAKHGRNDTLQEIMAAPDREELLAWLRNQRLLHAEGNHVLVHAGLLPQWTVAQAAALAREVENMLRGKNYRNFLARMYGNSPNRWEDGLSGMGRFRVITNAMTRMRFITSQGVMEFAHKGPPRNPPPGYLPWFEVPGRLSAAATIVCGHWSALGLQLREGLMTLDTGCLWGGQLSAVRLEDRAVFQVACSAPPGTRRWL